MVDNATPKVETPKAVEAKVEETPEEEIVIKTKKK